ncbi:MAG: flagellar biosynthetic protein FliO [Butyrivibrio sp.]|nr:flagellar biosynthetic protein FliO [Butyrivibrio sp.]
MGTYLQFVFVLIVFVLVLAATYFVTKWLAGYQKERNTSSNIEILETARISTTKYIQIVKIGEKLFAIAVGKDEVTLLGELSKDDVVIREDDPSENINFKDILEKIKGEKRK